MLLRLPKIGMEMTEAVVARWLAADGSTVVKGQPLYELETDKVTNEIEAPADGRLRHIAVECHRRTRKAHGSDEFATGLSELREVPPKPLKAQSSPFVSTMALGKSR